jgi:hypothetical protein
MAALAIHQINADSTSTRRYLTNLIGAPERLPHGSRIVWILARPLDGRIYSVASGAFPLCHWAVLISDVRIGVTAMRVTLASLQCPGSARVSDSDRLGIIHQLFRNPDRVTSCHRYDTFTILDLKTQFPSCSIAYAGTTRCNDDRILNFGFSNPRRVANTCSKWNYGTTKRLQSDGKQLSALCQIANPRYYGSRFGDSNHSGIDAPFHRLRG